MPKIVKKQPEASRPLKVGITGGIGSGKTTVCKIFEALGVPVYYADERAKALMTEDLGLKAKITALFGAQAYRDDGSLDRQHIAGIVFQDKKKLEELNAAVHPAVLADGERWSESRFGAPYTLKEAALLFESGSHRMLDKIIVVFAPKELRLQRVMQRDGVGREAVEARMDSQMPDEEKLKLADFVIFNDGSRPLLRQVWELHRMLRRQNAG